MDFVGMEDNDPSRTTHSNNVPISSRNQSPHQKNPGLLFGVGVSLRSPIPDSKAITTLPPFSHQVGSFVQQYNRNNHALRPSEPKIQSLPCTIDIIPTLSFEIIPTCDGSDDNTSKKLMGTMREQMVNEKVPPQPSMNLMNHEKEQQLLISNVDPNPTLLYPPEEYSTPHLLYHLFILRTQLAQWGKLFGTSKPSSRHNDNRFIFVNGKEDDSSGIKISELAIAYDYLLIKYITIYLLLTMAPPQDLHAALKNGDRNPIEQQSLLFLGGDDDMTTIPLPWKDTDSNELVQLNSHEVIHSALSTEHHHNKNNKFIFHTISTGFTSPLYSGGHVAPLDPIEITARFGHIVPDILTRMLNRVLGCEELSIVFGDEDGQSGRSEPPDYLTRSSYYNPHGFTPVQIRKIHLFKHPWAVRREIVKQLKVRWELKNEPRTNGISQEDAPDMVKMNMARWIHNRFPHQGPKNLKIHIDTVYFGPTEVLWYRGMDEAPPPDENNCTIFPTYGGSLDHYVCYSRGQKAKVSQYVSKKEYFANTKEKYENIIQRYPLELYYDGEELNEHLSTFLSQPSLSSSILQQSTAHSNNTILTLKKFLRPLTHPCNNNNNDNNEKKRKKNKNIDTDNNTKEQLCDNPMSLPTSSGQQLNNEEFAIPVTNSNHNCPLGFITTQSINTENINIESNPPSVNQSSIISSSNSGSSSSSSSSTTTTIYTPNPTTTATSFPLTTNTKLPTFHSCNRTNDPLSICKTQQSGFTNQSHYQITQAQIQAINISNPVGISTTRGNIQGPFTNLDQTTMAMTIPRTFVPPHPASHNLSSTYRHPPLFNAPVVLNNNDNNTNLDRRLGFLGPTIRSTFGSTHTTIATIKRQRGNDNTSTQGNSSLNQIDNNNNNNTNHLHASLYYPHHNHHNHHNHLHLPSSQSFQPSLQPSSFQQSAIPAPFPTLQTFLPRRAQLFQHPGQQQPPKSISLLNNPSIQSNNCTEHPNNKYPLTTRINMMTPISTTLEAIPTNFNSTSNTKGTNSNFPSNPPHYPNNTQNIVQNGQTLSFQSNPLHSNSNSHSNNINHASNNSNNNNNNNTDGNNNNNITKSHPQPHNNNTNTHHTNEISHSQNIQTVSSSPK